MLRFFPCKCRLDEHKRLLAKTGRFWLVLYLVIKYQIFVVFFYQKYIVNTN